MALGHWAKTYLNPNGGGTELPSVTASDNGKVLGVDGGEYKLVNGASPEIIKLASINGGGGPVDTNGNVGFFKGGGAISDNKTLGEMLNGKRIIGTRMVATVASNQGDEERKQVLTGSITLSNGGTYYDPVTDYNEPIYPHLTSVYVFGLAEGTVKTGTAVDVYAICI